MVPQATMPHCSCLPHFNHGAIADFPHSPLCSIALPFTFLTTSLSPTTTPVTPPLSNCTPTLPAPYSPSESGPQMSSFSFHYITLNIAHPSTPTAVYPSILHPYLSFPSSLIHPCSILLTCNKNITSIQQTYKKKKITLLPL